MAFAVVRQEACTVAVMLKEALAVAAAAGLGVRPDATIQNARIDNPDLVDIALPLTRKTAAAALIGSSWRNFRVVRPFKCLARLLRAGINSHPNNQDLPPRIPFRKIRSGTDAPV
jgi:hypothetical protein